MINSIQSKRKERAIFPISPNIKVISILKNNDSATCVMKRLTNMKDYRTTHSQICKVLRVLEDDGFLNVKLIGRKKIYTITELGHEAIKTCKKMMELFVKEDKHIY